MMQALVQRREWQSADMGRGQLDRERQAVEVAADRDMLADCPSTRNRLHRPRALVRAEPLRWPVTPRQIGRVWRERQGVDQNSCSPWTRKGARLVARTCRAGQAARRPATSGRRLEHVLAVVDQQEPLMGPQLPDSEPAIGRSGAGDYQGGGA